MDKTSSITVVEYIVVGCKNMEKKQGRYAREKRKSRAGSHTKKERKDKKTIRGTQQEARNKLIGIISRSATKKRKKKVDEKQVDS